MANTINNSILNTVKPMIGIAPADTSFDLDIITHINSVFVILAQLGVNYKGSLKDGSAFSITGSTETWDDFLPDNYDLQIVKTFMEMKVRKMFDPPQSSSADNAMTELLKELEFRINVMVDPGV